MSEELNEESTTDEVSAEVDKIVEEVKNEREGQKSDAEITASIPEPQVVDEHSNDNDSITDDSDSGSDGNDWLDDELKSEIASYGISEDELADFANREELDRALRFLDKAALDAGRKSLAEGEAKSEDNPDRDEKGRFRPKDEPKDSRFESKLDPDIYDEEIVSEFARLNEHYESRLEKLEQFFSEASAAAEEQRFDNLVDSMNHEDLFGKTGSESKDQLQRRQDLIVAVKAQQIGLQQLGRQSELDHSLVNRVARMVFADQLSKKELKQRTRKISRQSNGRQGGGVTRPTDVPESARDEFDRLYKEMAG